MARTAVFIQNKGDGISVSGTAITLTKPSKSGFSCYISGFDVYFYAANHEVRVTKTKAFIKMYFNHFLSGGVNLSRLALDLNKKGFKADNHNTVMFSLINNKPVKAHFNSLKTSEPNDFADATVMVDEFNHAA